MLRKLFSSIFQSMRSPSEFPGSPEEFAGPRDVVDTTAWVPSLPTDLLLEIFLRLEEPTDVIRCAGVCKPWRRAIIGNAAILRPRPDRSDPRLLLGVFRFSRYDARLLRAPGPFQSALPPNGVGRLGGLETARSLIPDADRGSVYRELLWSADGFILLMARAANSLCLLNPITGACTFLPAAAAPNCSAYVFLTTGSAVRILAVHKRDRFMFGKDKEEEEGLSYQQILITPGVVGSDGLVWGPVQRASHDSESDQVEQGAGAAAGGLCVWMEHRSTVVCRDAVVYWLAGPRVFSITCTLALDVRTGRTWTTELPQRYRPNSRAFPDTSVPILATSGDGLRPCLMESMLGSRIQVWVMTPNDGGGDGARWTLQQTVAIGEELESLLMPSCVEPDDPIAWLVKATIAGRHLRLSAFCPRSGCVVAACLGREVLIDIRDDHSDSRPRVRRFASRPGRDYHPYEMDSSSTYISKMKHF